MPGFGSMLKDYLEYYKISQSDFADRLGITQKHMNEIINGKTKISPELMVIISLLTDIDVNIIFYAEKAKEVYEELMNKYKREKEIKKMINSYHYNEMFKMKWIKSNISTTFVYNYMDLMDFMSIRDINQIDNYLEKRYMFKKAKNSTKDDHLKIFLWVRHCEIITKGIELPDYNSNKFDDLINELKIERMKPFNKEDLIKLFHKYGIILCIEDALKGSKVRGCIRVMIKTPAIYMTRYMKDKSSFYYTLYHELAHLKRDYNKLKSKTLVIEENHEDELDQVALNYMIDNNIYNEILNDYDNREKIALKNNIPLSFLYSRLAHDKKIKYNSKEYLDNKETI